MHRASKLPELQVSNDVSKSCSTGPAKTNPPKTAASAAKYLPSAWPVRACCRPRTEKLNMCPVIRSDLFWFICFALILILECHLLILYNRTVSYCHWLLLFKGPKKAYKISILKKVSNPWITRCKEDLEGAFCSHSHSTLRQSHGPTTRCVATLIHRSANACWCSA